MYRLKAWIRMFFGFSRTETNAFLILIPLMIVVLFSEPVYRNFRSSQPPDFFGENKSIDSLIASLEWNDSTLQETKSLQGVTLLQEIKFHAFDPNVISEDEFKFLGLSQFLSSRIIRYREKGGKFYKPSDLSKIYGMDSSWYKKAAPWIAIVQEKKTVPAVRTNQIRNPIEKIDINQADSLQLVAVFGVGPKLSKRILTFRNKLGGFVSMLQLKDVYGLDSVVVKALSLKFFVAENFEPLKKINLNTANKDDLLGNPYIRYKEADAILAYRLQHGPFTSPDNLKEINLLTPAWLEKVRPYLVLE